MVDMSCGVSRGTQPGGQYEHDSALNVGAAPLSYAQSSQTALPRNAENFPSGHILHAEAFTAAYVGEKLPMGQAMQEAGPAELLETFWNVPGGQASHNPRK